MKASLPETCRPKIAGTIRSKNPLKGAVEILPERLYYAALKIPPPSHNILASTPRPKDEPSSTPLKKKQIHFFNIDNELVYWNFFLDFGPLNLGQFARFCAKLHDKLRKFPVVCFYSATAPAKRANAVFLICAWQLLYLDRTPHEAYAGFDKELFETLHTTNATKKQASAVCSQPPVSLSLGSYTIASLPPFHDASPCACTYDLTVLDCLQGMVKARVHGFYNHETFDVDEYEHFEQVENGDLNWLVKDKILAFAGPSYERNVSPEGYCTLAPADYIPYFRRRNVGLVVRLNKKMYNEQDFIDTGIDHLDAFFLDGSCPPTKILMKVLEAFEAVPADKAFAVHCKAGLGRTGTCIGAYLMKHYRFTAAEAIGWMRICRPGCVIGPQQHFLKQIEHVMWQEGETAHVKRPLLKLADSEESMATSNDDDDDAVDGRPEQAEGLLAARGRRELVTKTESRGISTQINSPSTPNGPPDKGERQPAAVVTPDAQPQTQLWCG